MISRRKVVLALGASAFAPRPSFAQQQPKVRRIGFLAVRSRSTSSNPEPNYDVFVQGMREFGYAEGRNLVIEWRFAEGKYERLPALAAELTQLKPEVIVTQSTPATEALRRATSSIPIVTAAVGDPVGSGFAVSLARPGGNVTGLSVIVTESSGKHVELLKNALPQLSRFALLVNPGNTSVHEDLFKAVQTTAKKLGLTVLRVDARSAEDIDRGFNAMTKERAGAVMVANDAFFIRSEERRVGKECRL